MIKITGKQLKSLKPPFMAIEYNEKHYDTFEGCSYIYYQAAGRECSEPFPILNPELGVDNSSMLGEYTKVPLGVSVPTSDLETSGDIAPDDNSLFVLYEEGDILMMINKLQQLLPAKDCIE